MKTYDPNKEGFCNLCHTWWPIESLPGCGWWGKVVHVCHECLQAYGAEGVGVAIDLAYGREYVEHIRAGGTRSDWPPFVALGAVDHDFARDFRKERG